MDNFLVPLYIGKSSTPGSSKSKAKDSYYFYGCKDGMGRFIKHSNYPFWDMGSKLPDFLVLEEPPDNVIQDVKAFVEGRVEFTLIPKTKGKHEKVLRKEVSFKQEYGVNENASISNESGRVPTGTSTDGTEKPTYQRLPEETCKTGNSESQGNRLPSQTQDRPNPGGEGEWKLPTSGRDQPDPVRRLRTGPDTGGKLPGSTGVAGDSTGDSSVSGTRRESEPGVLDNSGNGTRPSNGQSAIHGSIDSTFDGSAPVKQKRVRRTKEELASGRSLEDIRASREG